MKRLHLAWSPRFPLAVLLLPVLAAGCAAPSPLDLGPAADDPIWESDDAKEDSSASALVRRISWEGFVLVPAGADDARVRLEVQRQVKSALGALHHAPLISLRDRDARSSIDAASLRREPVVQLAADGKEAGALERVRYRYSDLALVAKKSPLAKATDFDLPLLFGDYVARAAELAPGCADDPRAEPDSLWYHYDPAQAACKRAISDEKSAINAAGRGLSTGRIAAADAARRFLSVRASLAPSAAPRTTWPEYDRLFGFGTSRQKIVAYSFFGVDGDDRDPRDNGLVEDLRFVRTLRAQYPGLKVTETQPFALLLDFTVDGKTLPGIGYDDVARWVLDRTGWPAAVGADVAKQAALLAQVRDKWLERWIVWQQPLAAKYRGEARTMTLEVRTYYGREDGRADWREAARNRYLEAFWHADVFSYTGHSHFGHGPLEPVGYNGGNFPDRYQVMLFNSCLSYNYYDIDFLELHPGGAKNLDVVVNGLPAWWTGMGEATARYLLGLVDGKGGSWVELLQGMVVKNSSFPNGYEPMRAVTGEEQNAFNPTAGRVEVTAAP